MSKKKEVPSNPQKQKKKPGRRKIEINDITLAKIYQLALRGCTDKEIYNTLRVSQSYFYAQMNKKEELYQAVITGRESMIERVENALFKIAIGYDMEETHTTIRDVDSKQTKEVKKIKKHLPPQFNAIEYILNNKAKDKWAKAAKIEHSGEVSHSHIATEIVFAEMTKKRSNEPEPEHPDETESGNE